MFKNKRFISLVIIFILISSLLFGCNHQKTNGEVNANESLEVEDMAGRKISIPAKVDRIFSVDPVGTILLYSLNPDKMAGWNYELREGEKRFIGEKYQILPNLGDAGKETINIEELLKVDPEALIMVTKIDDSTLSKVDELEKQTGKAIVVLDYNMKRLDEAYEILGEIMDEEDKAKELAKYCKKTLDEIRKNSSKIIEEKKMNIYYAEGPDGLQTEPAGSWHVQVIDMIGGRNVAQVEVKGEKGKSEVSIEQVLAWDPDIIISWDDERGGYYSEIYKDSNWKDIKAVKNREVYEIPNKPFNWFDRPPSINRILGLKWLGNLLYPDVYNYDMRNEVKEFYDKFYHYKLSEDEIDELLQNSTRH